MTIEQDDENDDLDDEDYDEFDLDGSRASGMAGNSSEGFPMTGASGSSSGSKSVGSREGGSSFYGQCGNGISQPNFSGNKISDRHLGKSVATASTSSTASEENVSQTISEWKTLHHSKLSHFFKNVANIYLFINYSIRNFNSIFQVLVDLRQRVETVIQSSMSILRGTTMVRLVEEDRLG